MFRRPGGSRRVRGALSLCIWLGAVRHPTRQFSAHEVARGGGRGEGARASSNNSDGILFYGCSELVMGLGVPKVILNLVALELLSELLPLLLLLVRLEVRKRFVPNLVDQGRGDPLFAARGDSARAVGARGLPQCRDAPRCRVAPRS